jgi:hypothetical protein
MISDKQTNNSDRINRMDRMLPAGRKSAAADDKPLPAQIQTGNQSTITFLAIRKETFV